MNLAKSVCVLALTVAVGCGAEPAPALFLSRSTFDVQSTVLLNELAGKRRDVGSRLTAALTVEPVAQDADRLLLRFQLQDVTLWTRGAHALAEWQARGAAWGGAGGEGGAGEPFYAERRAGGALAAVLAAEPPDVLNYKRALLSLFQFQPTEGEHKESDVSGECDVSYETLSSTLFRKLKRRCAFERDGVRARRVARYSLGDAGLLAELHAEEVLWLTADDADDEGDEDEEPLGVKARSWHALTLRAAARAGVLAPDVGAARAALPAGHTPAALALDHAAAPDEPEHPAEDLEAAVARHGAALAGDEPGAGGTRAQLAALQPLLAALSAAPAPALAALLHAAAPAALPALCRALGLAATPAAWHAARAFLAPAAPDALEPLALHYLAGLALAPAPHRRVLEDALALADDAARPAVAEAALLAAAAASARAPPEAALAARDRLLAGLARCRSVPCRAARLRALGNARREDAAGALLAAAERGDAEDAEAALSALRPLSPRALDPAQLERAALLAGNASRALAVRALALEAAVEGLCAPGRETVPLALVRLARALGAERGPHAPELRRALWRRLATLEEREAVRALRRLMPRDLRTWDALAPAGTSDVLLRRLGWRAGAWRGALSSSALAARALLVRGRVALLAQHERRRRSRELLAVEVWTRGLAAVAGGGEDAPAEAEAEAEAEAGPAAGLQVAVLGAALPPLTLFSGQAELLGHIWSGAGSEPTSAVRALVPLAARGVRAPLLAGAVLAGGAQAAAALALDARAAASLWHRTASARLALRAAGRAHVWARVSTSWARLEAAATLEGEARLRIAPDLDFYDGVALCVRVELEPHRTERTVRLRSASGAWRVRRGSAASVQRAGRTLALGRENDAACRAHAPPDPSSPDF